MADVVDDASESSRSSALEPGCLCSSRSCCCLRACRFRASASMRLPPERRPRLPPRAAPRPAPATAPLSRADRTDGSIVAAAHRLDGAMGREPELRSMGGSSACCAVVLFGGGGVGVEALTRRSSMPKEEVGRSEEPWCAGGGGAEGDVALVGSSRWATCGDRAATTGVLGATVLTGAVFVPMAPGRLVLLGGGGGAKNCWSCFSCCCCKLWDRSARSLALSASISNLRLLLLRLVPLSKSSFGTGGTGLWQPAGTVATMGGNSTTGGGGVATTIGAGAGTVGPTTAGESRALRSGSSAGGSGCCSRTTTTFAGVCSGVACGVGSEPEAADDATGEDGDSVGVAGSIVKP